MTCSTISEENSEPRSRFMKVNLGAFTKFGAPLLDLEHNAGLSLPVDTVADLHYWYSFPSAFVSVSLRQLSLSTLSVHWIHICYLTDPGLGLSHGRMKGQVVVYWRILTAWSISLHFSFLSFR
jgi:hypothetical protein